MIIQVVQLNWFETGSNGFAILEDGTTLAWKHSLDEGVTTETDLDYAQWMDLANEVYGEWKTTSKTFHLRGSQ